MSFFAGGDSSFVTTGSAVTTSGFSTPTSTSTQPVVVHDAMSPAETNVADWIRTPEAQARAGRWVLLSPEQEVLDSSESPSDLLARHAGEAAPTIVFVDASAKQYAL